MKNKIMLGKNIHPKKEVKSKLVSPETVSSFQLGALITFPLHLHANRSLPVNNALSVVSAVCPDEIITLAWWMSLAEQPSTGAACPDPCFLASL